jgi:hypothetical protein
MIIKDGLVNGVYYEKNKVVAYKGLIEVDGAYYYINDNGKPVANKTYYVRNTNDLCLPNGEPIAKGSYQFDADGKMILG